MELGMKVKVRFYQQETVNYRNITEVHYRYPTTLGIARVALESDIHGTGATLDLCDVAEFEVYLETELAEAF